MEKAIEQASFLRSCLRYNDNGAENPHGEKAKNIPDLNGN